MSVSTTTSVEEGAPQRKLSPHALARRDEILEAALEVISRQGFHQTSMAAIADRVHVSRPTVYQHFRDKRDILVALADRIARRIIATVDSWPALPSPPEGFVMTPEQCQATKDVLWLTLEMRTTQVLEAISANADAARLVIRLTRGQDRLVDDMFRQIDEHVVAVLTRDLETAISYGWVRPCNARLIARFLLGGLEKLVMDALDRDEPLRLNTKALVAEIGALQFFGLAHKDVFGPPAHSD
jgi:AcrR family transcriptional regulator